MFNKPVSGIVSLEIRDKNSNELVTSLSAKNTISNIWLTRLAGYVGGFGGVDINEIRPYEIIAYSNENAAESSLSSISSSVVNSTSTGLTGNAYFDSGNIDISWIGNGTVQYKADFNPGEDGVTQTSYIIRSLRLATSGGSVSLQGAEWTSDQYCPVAYLKVKSFSNTTDTITVAPNQILIVKWSLYVV